MSTLVLQPGFANVLWWRGAWEGMPGANNWTVSFWPWCFRGLLPCLSRRGLPTPRTTEQPVIRGKHHARSRSSEHSSVRPLCSVHHLAPGGSAPPSPLLTRLLLRVQHSFHVLPPGCQCGVVLSWAYMARSLILAL